MNKLIDLMGRIKAVNLKWHEDRMNILTEFFERNGTDRKSVV